MLKICYKNKQPHIPEIRTTRHQQISNNVQNVAIENLEISGDMIKGQPNKDWKYEKVLKDNIARKYFAFLKRKKIKKRKKKKKSWWDEMSNHITQVKFGSFKCGKEYWKTYKNYILNGDTIVTISMECPWNIPIYMLWKTSMLPVV